MNDIKLGFLFGLGAALALAVWGIVLGLFGKMRHG